MACTDVSDAALKKRFAQLGFQRFICRQCISLWRNDRARNEKISSAFNRFVTALVQGSLHQAERERNTLAENCRFWVLRRAGFMRLAYAEYSYYCAAADMRENTAMVFAALGIAPAKREAFCKSLHAKLVRSRSLSQCYRAFLDFKNDEEAWRRLPVKNCAVCATMGAGKSTFINALLGADVLPARNEATTAKVTSIYDKDGQTAISGFALTRDGRFTAGSVDFSPRAMDEANSDPAISRVFLQGDFDGIGNRHFAVSIHDTPGTNNSLDPSHHAATIDFLTAGGIDLVLFVLNAEHPRTDDERRLLEEVLQKVVRKRRVRVIFILGKADSIDPQKESLAQNIADFETYLANLGYEKPRVFPAAAKIARLVKMSMKGAAPQFTEDERDALELGLRRFGVRARRDFAQYAHFLSTDTRLKANAIAKTVRDGASPAAAALWRTGIPAIETAIAECLEFQQRSTQ